MFVIFVLVGDLVGGILGEILMRLSPPGILRDVFLKVYPIGFTPPFTVDLHLVTLTLGLTLQVTLFSLIGMILGIYTYRQL
jgi:hypothetical protein